MQRFMIATTILSFCLILSACGSDGGGNPGLPPEGTPTEAPPSRFGPLPPASATTFVSDPATAYANADLGMAPNTVLYSETQTSLNILAVTPGIIAPQQSNTSYSSTEVSATTASDGINVLIESDGAYPNWPSLVGLSDETQIAIGVNGIAYERKFAGGPWTSPQPLNVAVGDGWSERTVTTPVPDSRSVGGMAEVEVIAKGVTSPDGKYTDCIQLKVHTRSVTWDLTKSPPTKLTDSIGDAMVYFSPGHGSVFTDLTLSVEYVDNPTLRSIDAEGTVRTIDAPMILSN